MKQDRSSLIIERPPRAPNLPKMYICHILVLYMYINNCFVNVVLSFTYVSFVRRAYWPDLGLWGGPPELTLIYNKVLLTWPWFVRRAYWPDLDLWGGLTDLTLICEEGLLTWPWFVRRAYWPDLGLWGGLTDLTLVCEEGLLTWPWFVRRAYWPDLDLWGGPPDLTLVSMYIHNGVTIWPFTPVHCMYDSAGSRLNEILRFCLSKT